MKKTLWLAVAVALLLPLTAAAHVPYFEHIDFTEQRPFVVRNGVEQSIAVYSWLETDMVNPSDDIDVYMFQIDEPTQVYLEAIVPVCAGYEDFAPWYALVGPGLPLPSQLLPFELPPGYGAIVMENTEPGEEREMFYEFFGNQWYYEGPVFDEMVYEPGTYLVYYWDPYELGGDYTSVIGAAEIWGLWDIIRALIYTPMIRQGRELHIQCL